MTYRPEWDVYFMLQAEIAKLRSNCLSRQVGCVIVKENRQIATGYNGTPSGITNCFEGGCPRCFDRHKGLIRSGERLERCLCTHAEANAIMQCALFGIGSTTKNSTLYSTFSPCLECSKMVISVGITRVVSLASYAEDGSEILNNANVLMVRLKQNDLVPWITTLNERMESRQVP
jgi:dCMP deaminase